jgi:uncharacterized membrane protein
MNWAHAGTATAAAFLASLVEFVEALTIVLAVGTTRGWRPALIGAGAGALFLTILTLVFGPALQRVAITSLQLVVGVLLLLFGLRWLRKAMLRAAGRIGLHDEAAIYEREQAALSSGMVAGTARTPLDRIALATSFKAVTLEGLEVIFIVIATGAGGQLLGAALGALAAGVLVILAGIALHRPLTRVPENTLKFAVGVLLSAFGVFWIGEGLRFVWPGEDMALLGLVAGFTVVALLTVAALGRRRLQTATGRETIS